MPMILESLSSGKLPHHGSIGGVASEGFGGIRSLLPVPAGSCKFARSDYQSKVGVLEVGGSTAGV